MKTTDKPAVPDVPLDVWRNLFSAATVFYREQPWELFSEEDLIGVYDDEKKEMGYVCLTGSAGLMYGLLAYRGIRGLQSYRKLRKRRGASEELVFEQDCLKVELVTRDMLQSEDIQVLDRLDIRWKKMPVPSFRSLLPGFFPWFIDGHEARYLTIVLKCITLLAQESIKQKFDPRPDGNEITCCRNFHQEGKRFTCDLSREELPSPKAEKTVFAPLRFDENAAASFRSRLVPHGVWEAGVSRFPEPVSDGGRPYFPVLAAVVDAESGFVLKSQLFKPGEALLSQMVAEIFVGAVAEHTVMPFELHVKDDATAGQLEPLAAAFDIRITKSAKLSSLTRFLRESGKHFRRKT